MYYSTRFCN